MFTSVKSKSEGKLRAGVTGEYCGVFGLMGAIGAGFCGYG